MISRSIEPRVSKEASREELIRWLVWNDRNGCYTDDDRRLEGYEPMTHEEARQQAEEDGAFNIRLDDGSDIIAVYTDIPTDVVVRWGSNDDPRDLLIIGQRYVVKEVEIHSYHTKLVLADFPDKKFNSASFNYPQEVWDREVEKWRKDRGW